MNKIKFNSTEVEILIKDIIESNLDAIVIPANTRLLPSGPLRCAVLRKAGSKVQLECNQIINKIGVINVGTAVMTSGGNLSKYIIHVVGPKYGQGNEGKKLMFSTWNSLKVAEEAGLNSIAFSPISLEYLGFNAKICAEVMLPTIKKFALEKIKYLGQISIFLTDLPEYKEFEKVLDKMAD
jgi:O-acetyl-ADP-ribose deacetylase (regulator of RNase III)